MKRSIIAFSSIIGIALAALAQNATLVECGSETIVLCTDINFGGTCITWTQQSHCCKSGISIFERKKNSLTMYRGLSGSIFGPLQRSNFLSLCPERQYRMGYVGVSQS
jgi:hypothetical protein